MSTQQGEAVNLTSGFDYDILLDLFLLEPLRLLSPLGLQEAWHKGEGAGEG